MPVLTASSNFNINVSMVLQKGNISIITDKPMLTNDIKGKRIGYPSGSISHYFLLNLLHDSGMEENELKLIPMDVTTMANALQNNEIDLFTAWEPTVASALKQYPEFFKSYSKISTGYLYFLKEFVEKNPKIVNQILAATIRAITWLKNDRENLLLACLWNIEEIEKLTGEKCMLDSEEFADLAMADILRYHSKYSIVVNDDDTQINSSLHKEFRFLKELNLVPISSEWDKVRESFDLNLVLEIYKQSKEFNLDKFDYDSNFNEH